MLGSVLAKTVRDARRGLAWWILGLAGLVVLTLSIWPSVDGNEDFARAVESYPEALQAFFGGAFELSTPEGYLNAELYSFMVPLLLIVYAVAAGARALAGEEEAGTLDLLLANPISRERVALEKLAATAALLAALTLALVALVALCARLFGLEIALANVAAASLAVWLLALLHGTLALAVGAATGSRSLALAVPAALGVGGYLLNGLAGLVDALEGWRALSPFHWYERGAPLREGLDPAGVGVLAAATVVLAAAAPVLFRRRDLAV